MHFSLFERRQVQSDTAVGNKYNLKKLIGVATYNKVGTLFW